MSAKKEQLKVQGCDIYEVSLHCLLERYPEHGALRCELKHGTLAWVISVPVPDESSAGTLSHETRMVLFNSLRDEMGKRIRKMGKKANMTIKKFPINPLDPQAPREGIIMRDMLFQSDRDWESQYAAYFDIQFTELKGTKIKEIQLNMEQSDTFLSHFAPFQLKYPNWAIVDMEWTHPRESQERLKYEFYVYKEGVAKTVTMWLDWEGRPTYSEEEEFDHEEIWHAYVKRS